MELDRHGVELRFQVLTEREEKNGVAIASNEAFGGWTKTFKTIDSGLECQDGTPADPTSYTTPSAASLFALVDHELVKKQSRPGSLQFEG